MTLQKCEPIPFYVLDEIDTTLDPIYLERIVNLIRQESSKSQYFISSFKQEMLDFSEDICNYYLVSWREKSSASAGSAKVMPKKPPTESLDDYLIK